jgi:TPR repeat protein
MKGPSVASVAFLVATLLAPVSAGAVDPPVHDCDRLAAHPLDEDAVARPVSKADFDKGRALEACRAALDKFPSTPRFQLQLGRALYESDQYEPAVEWFRKAAAQGYSLAMYALGSMYREGRGLPQDDIDAVAWFRKGAEHGNTTAQYALGWMYQQGRGVPRDDAQGVAWYRRAAEQGNDTAQYSLGWMYQEGRGVPRDEAKAALWYRKAADQGNPTALYALGWINRGAAKR